MKEKGFFQTFFMVESYWIMYFIENNTFLMNEQEWITLWELPHFIFCVFLPPC